jgi:hypothetical protein
METQGDPRKPKRTDVNDDERPYGAPDLGLMRADAP